MAFPTAVNSQITDSVTQSNVQVVGSAAAMAAGSVYQSAAHAHALLLHNATQQQQHMAILAQAVTAAAVNLVAGKAQATDLAAVLRTPTAEV